VKVGAAVTRRIETEPPELGGDVLGRQLSTAGAGPAALEGIVGQKLQVGLDHLPIYHASDLRPRGSSVTLLAPSRLNCSRGQDQQNQAETHEDTPLESQLRTAEEGQSCASAQSEQRGRRAMQTFRPWKMSRCESRPQLSRGKSFIS
jgi:hypothetical protein